LPALIMMVWIFISYNDTSNTSMDRLGQQVLVGLQVSQDLQASAARQVEVEHDQAGPIAAFAAAARGRHE